VAATDYYSTVAQVIPVVFIICAFELNRVLELEPDEDEEPISADEFVKQTGARAMFFVAVTLTAILGESAALRVLHDGADTHQRYVLTICSLAALAVSLIVAPLAVAVTNIAGRRLAEIPDPPSLADIGRQLEALDATDEDPATKLARLRRELDEGNAQLEQLRTGIARVRRWPPIGKALVALWFAATFVTPIYWLAAFVF
jgi:hypothetical protein